MFLHAFPLLQEAEAIKPFYTNHVVGHVPDIEKFCKCHEGIIVLLHLDHNIRRREMIRDTNIPKLQQYISDLREVCKLPRSSSTVE